ncbi:leucyl aminopeptidase [Thiomicrorhabdus sp. zzn3]|uniref:leucyl aminopeptidase n=1 Tax=Thiomicrorhabdus sp. zzn3 TaxID=3039775 RepID=UPI0024373CFE|nr:leucyl aminopeptidase [Thiomicrorhabdus sp. zzn3]MDG6777401.1 leucyl aminopeptidase [Thiomicrorhabdus sp. zzn3]
MKRIAFSFHTQTRDFDTLILPVFADGQLAENCHALDGASALAEQVAELNTSGDFDGKPGKTLMLMSGAGQNPKRTLLVGLGKADDLSVKTYLTAVRAAATAIENSGAENVLNALVLVQPTAHESQQAWSVRQNAQIFQQSFYDYAHESRGEHHPKDPKLNAMALACEDNADNEAALTQGQATALGMALTQDLANMPSNFCTPSYLAETAEELGKTYGFETHILDRDEMIRMGMGSFMAVAQGTNTPPKMICLSYKGAGEEAPIALVGKGVTFDTGGISLKPGAAMDEMKYDMGGAATVLGVFKALGELKPNINVVGVIPSTENMPSGNAIKPGDVVTSLSGQTIEILNTDAEGRLILCDALTYAQQTYKPSKVIDMATLTGACIIALGHHVSGLMANDQELADALFKAGQETYDRFWQLPLGEEWDEQLKSNFADMANIGGRSAGTITAGQFLARFTQDVSWAHLDIAGTAWVSGDKKGATGRPVPAVVEFLLNQA